MIVITDSLCCTPEINIIVNCTPIKIKNKYQKLILKILIKCFITSNGKYRDENGKDVKNQRAKRKI